MKKILFFCLLLNGMLLFLPAQNLDRIGPITLEKGSPPDSVSFILTLTDFNYMMGKKLRFSSSVQILDANQPWPPRWFVTSPLDTMMGKHSDGVTPLINASVQNGKTIFSTSIAVQFAKGGLGREVAYLFLDSNLNAVDTFAVAGKEIDSHDFKVSPNGEKLYFVENDTVINLVSVYGDPADTAVKINYELIQIADASGKVIFSWDPLLHLGLKATYAPYRKEQSVVSQRPTLGWSHGNSLNWDKDGNILYSFKYIGIGKISRSDGHVFWHIDRNKLRPTPLSDSLPMFLQHDFQEVKHDDYATLYSVLSNGDADYYYWKAYQFTVHDSANYGPIVWIKNAAVMDHPMPVSGSGNYDVENDGSYLLNFGVYRIKDSVASQNLFEYHDRDNKLLGLYDAPPNTMAYRTHKIITPKPPRPRITKSNEYLIGEKGFEDYKWYKLSGPQLHTVESVGTGPKFKPAEKGSYCLTVKHGVGASVSQVFTVK